MGEVQELQLQVRVQENEEARLFEHRSFSDEPVVHQSRNLRRFILIAVYTFLVLSGQATATLLGRLYYDKGGKSKWMATFAQLAGFPILFPYYCIPLAKRLRRETIQANQPSLSILTLLYVSLGLLVAADSFLYSVGLQYLPVSTLNLIYASQLAFNAVFSFFINSQKFTPSIINSLVLLTISSTLLGFENDDSTDHNSDVSKGKYAIGFICTVAASAVYGLMLSLIQLVFKKFIKREAFTVIMDMIVYVNLVAICVIVVGLFASKEWKTLTREIEDYKLGKVSYIMNFVWTAISWQVFSIGSVGLIFETSSLLSNAISVVVLPIVSVLAVFVFHDKMDGLKVIAMVLALWGFLSFVYQQYLDDYKS